MNRTIFYSWQSDLPNSTNRSFIESVITKVISDLKRDRPTFLELSLDMDTSETPGTPDIVDTILKKISKTSLFIADAVAIAAPVPDPNTAPDIKDIN